MKRIIATLVLVLFVPQLFCMSLDHSAPLSDRELAQLRGTGWCGFFGGLASGLGAGAFVMGFIPGGQAFTVGAGATALLIKLGVELAC